MPARPYICRFSILSRLSCPSTGPLLHGSLTAASTALRCFKVRTKRTSEWIPVLRACSIQRCRVVRLEHAVKRHGELILRVMWRAGQGKLKLAGADLFTYMSIKFAAALDVLGSRWLMEKMSGQIFISYRREESRWSARSLYDRLSARFDRKQIFMDIDAIALGDDFVKAIEKTVCHFIIRSGYRH